MITKKNIFQHMSLFTRSKMVQRAIDQPMPSRYQLFDPADSPPKQGLTNSEKIALTTAIEWLQNTSRTYEREFESVRRKLNL
jgi:hypothetical protein